MSPPIPSKDNYSLNQKTIDSENMDPNVTLDPKFLEKMKSMQSLVQDYILRLEFDLDNYDFTIKKILKSADTNKINKLFSKVISKELTKAETTLLFLYDIIFYEKKSKLTPRSVPHPFEADRIIVLNSSTELEIYLGDIENFSNSYKKINSAIQKLYTKYHQYLK